MKWISIQQAIPKTGEKILMYYRDENDKYNPHICFGRVFIKEGNLEAFCVCSVYCRCDDDDYMDEPYYIDRQASRFYWMYEGDVQVPGWQELEIVHPIIKEGDKSE